MNDNFDDPFASTPLPVEVVWDAPSPSAIPSYPNDNQPEKEPEEDNGDSAGNILECREEGGGVYGTDMDDFYMDTPPMQYRPSLTVIEGMGDLQETEKKGGWCLEGLIASCLPVSPAKSKSVPVTLAATPYVSRKHHCQCLLQGGTKHEVQISRTKTKKAGPKKRQEWRGGKSHDTNLGMKLVGGGWADGWLIVQRVVPNLIAAREGILQGDVVLRINGCTPRWTTAAQQLVEGREVGLELIILRGAKVVLCKEGDKQKLTLSATGFAEQLTSGKLRPLLSSKTNALTPPLKVKVKNEGVLSLTGKRCAPRPPTSPNPSAK
jgi:hypothetical protein